MQFASSNLLQTIWFVQFILPHSGPTCNFNWGWNLAWLQLASWATKWHDYVVEIRHIGCATNPPTTPDNLNFWNITMNQGNGIRRPWESIWGVCRLSGGGQLRTGQVMTGQVRTCQVMIWHVRTGQVTSEQFKTCQVRTGHVRTGQVRTGHVRTSHVRAYQVRSGQVKSVQIKFGQVNSRQVRSGQVKSGHIKSGQVKSGQFKSG